MARVLVTGGNGFVGRAVLPHLIGRGYRVRAALHRETPLPDGVEAVVVGSLEQPIDWRPVLDDVDAVVHLAARVHVMGETGAEAWERYRRLNVEATRHLAAAAAAAGVRRFLLMSSVKALGEGTGGSEGAAVPLTETTVPAPADPYGRSKLEAEQALAAAAGAMAWVALRPPLVYGPGVGANFRRLMTLCRRGLPLPLAGIDHRRSLIFVGNLAHAVGLALDHPAAVGRCFLVQDGPALTVPDLIRRLSALFGRPARLWSLPESVLKTAATLFGAEAAYQRLCGSLVIDDAAFRRATAWQPPFTVDEGLRLTVEAERRR